MQGRFKQFEKYVSKTTESCWQFFIRVYNDFNLFPGNYWEKGFHENWTEIDKTKVKTLDAVFFSGDRPHGHIGIYIGSGYFIHAINGHILISKVNTYNEDGSLEGFYRWHG